VLYLEHNRQETDLANTTVTMVFSFVYLLVVLWVIPIVPMSFAWVFGWQFASFIQLWLFGFPFASVVAYYIFRH
jgi:hypothetical protein